MMEFEYFFIQIASDQEQQKAGWLEIAWTYDAAAADKVLLSLLQFQIIHLQTNWSIFLIWAKIWLLTVRMETSDFARQFFVALMLAWACEVLVARGRECKQRHAMLG